MHLNEIVSVSTAVAATRSRLEKRGILAGLLRRLQGDEVAVAVHFLSGDLRQGRIGIGPASLRAARPSTPADAASLGLLEVDAVLDRIAAAAGKGAGAERGRLLGELLSRATGVESAFLQRLVLGELRQGALAGLMVDALAEGTDVPAAAVRRAFMLAGNLPDVAAAVLAAGEAGLARFRLQLFRPLRPMLAQAASDASDALDRLTDPVVEYKLDGARVQVHRRGDDVRVYSRQLNDVTAAVPEVVEAALALPARALVLDGEVLALDSADRPHPFQVTMRRFGRRVEVARARAALPLSPFFFDLLHADGDDLIDAPGDERVHRLTSLAPALVVPRRRVASVEEAESFFDEALAAGHEGIMAKDSAAAYAAGSRGVAWLKIKPEHTLDLVVLAVEWGSGRRSGFLSNIHLGARDQVSGSFVMLGKTFKGMTDDMLAWQTRRFQELEVARDDLTVYVRPEQVVEIAISDVQESRQYPAGLALRFARVKRYRNDKAAGEADTVETIRALFREPKKRP